MPHFSRLTDIVTCNLTAILQSSPDPALTLREIIAEMEEGLSACRRTVRTSGANQERLRSEISEYVQQMQDWTEKAKLSIAAGNESAARDALIRKVELEGLIAGLQPEMEAAASTRERMLTIQKALEARHADAVRRLTELTGECETIRIESETALHSAAMSEQQKLDEVEAELAELKKQLGR